MSDQKPWAVAPIDASSAVVVATPPPAPPEQPFVLKPELYGKNRRLVITKLLLMYFGATAIGLAIGFYRGGLNVGALVFWLIFFLPIFSAVMVFMIWRRVGALKRRYFSTRVWIDEAGIRQERAEAPTVLITKEEITDCLEIPGKGTMVRTASSRRYIWVADELNGYGFALGKFREWGKLLPDSKPPMLLRPWLNFFLTMAAFAIIILSSSRMIVGVVGAGLLAIMAWQAYVCVFSSTADKQMRRQIWTVAFNALIVVARMLYVFLY